MITNPAAATVSPDMETEVPGEIRSNRAEDLFQPCWITKAIQSDRSNTVESEEEWMSLIVFEDEREMLEMIGDWGKPLAPPRRQRVKLKRVIRKK